MKILLFRVANLVSYGPSNIGKVKWRNFETLQVLCKWRTSTNLESTRILEKEEGAECIVIRMKDISFVFHVKFLYVIKRALFRFTKNLLWKHQMLNMTIGHVPIIVWSNEVFEIDRFMKNEWNKILYILIYNLCFNIVDHLLTRCWTFYDQMYILLKKFVHICNIFEISIEYLNLYVPLIFSGFLFFKITKSKKCQFFEENFFSYVSYFTKSSSFLILLLWKCSHRLVNDVRYIQNLLMSRRNEWNWKTT